MKHEVTWTFTPEQIAEQHRFMADLEDGKADIVFEGPVSEAKAFLKCVGELACHKTR